MLKSLPYLATLLLLWASANAQARKNMSFLAVSDIHLNKDKDSTKSNNKDTDLALWKQTTKKIKELLNGDGGQGNDHWRKPSFLLCLGDLPLHTTNQKARKANSAEVSVTLKKLAGAAGIPIIFAPGNNDPEEGRYMKLPDSTLCTTSFPLGTSQKLRVLSLNSVVFTRAYADRNPEIVSGQLDTALNLLKRALEQASDAGDNALIIMHIPPGWDSHEGSAMWNSPYKYDMDSLSVQNAFLKIIAPYRQRITGILASHTHMDGLRLIYDQKDSINNMLFSIPSIDPGHRNNPGVKLFTFDSASFEIKDCFTFYYRYYPRERGVQWVNDVYSFRQTFGCDADMPLRSCILDLQHADPEKVQAGNLKVYKVYGEAEAQDAGEADGSMEIKWQRM